MDNSQKRATVYFDTLLHPALRFGAAETDRSVSDLIGRMTRFGFFRVPANSRLTSYVPRVSGTPARRRYSLSLWLLVGVSGCAGLPNVATQVVDGRRVEFVSAGQGSPVVVLETGMGPTLETWRGIFTELSATTRVFAYNRPGYGRSSAHPAPQSAQDLAERLHRTLEETGHPPPYVVVGHSAGGL